MPLISFPIRCIVCFLLVLLLAVGLKSPVHSEEENLAETSRPDQTGSDIVPNRDIQYAEDLAPGWKTTWDYARELSRQEKFGEALIQYELLLARKDNVDEARWEAASVALYLGRWRQAEEQLEILLNHDPDNSKYLLVCADAAVEAGNYARAVVLYERVLAAQGQCPEPERALAGLSRAYQGQPEEKASALPVLAQLIERQPGDRELRQRAAGLALELDRAADALVFLGEWEGCGEDPAWLRLNARIAGQLGHEDKAAAFWRQCLAITGDDLSGHAFLADYYRTRGDFAGELRHVQELVRLAPDTVEFLERAAELSLRRNRADRALDYYARIVTITPEDQRVREKRRKVRELVARDLLVLVENQGERMLWHDLVKVTSDRLGVYRAMAELLRARGKPVELINVLKIIYEEDKDDGSVAAELGSLLAEQGRFDELQIIFSGDVPLGGDLPSPVHDGAGNSGTAVHLSP